MAGPLLFFAIDSPTASYPAPGKHVPVLNPRRLPPGQKKSRPLF